MAAPLDTKIVRMAIVGRVWTDTNRPANLSGRARNTVDGIMQRFQYGRGVSGQTFADLLNGYTEYYTSAPAPAAMARPKSGAASTDTAAAPPSAKQTSPTCSGKWMPPPRISATIPRKAATSSTLS
jgi:hypothetical protein